MCEDGLTPDGWVTVGCITCGKPTTVQKQFQNSARCNDCVLAPSRKRFEENPPTSPITKVVEIPGSVIGYTEFPRPTHKYETEKLMDRVSNDIRDTCKIFEQSHEQLQSIKATLVVNCQPDRELNKLGLSYKEKFSVENNLIYFLEQLVFKINELQKQAEDLRHDKQ